MKLETNKTEKNILGNNIKELRRSNNISQEELAQKLFISRTAISKWESGATEPNIEFLRKMASIFNVDLNQLIKYEQQQEQEAKIVPKQNLEEIIVKPKDESKFTFKKAYYSKVPKEPKDSKLFKKMVGCYAASGLLFAIGFYLTIIVLIVWGHKQDTSNKYTLQIIAGIPLMIIGIVLVTLTLKRHLLFDLLKRKTMFNSDILGWKFQTQL